MYQCMKAIFQYSVLIFLFQLRTEVTMSLALSGSNVLITGGGRGIGRAIARICAEEGAHVAICSRTKIELEKTAASITSAQCHPMEIFETDLTKEDQVEHMVDTLVKKWGHIDVLINNAGKGQGSKSLVHTLKSKDLENILNLNVVSVHSVTSAVLQKSMIENRKGRIINISSRAAKIGIPNISFYVTSKFALEGYSAAIAEELKDYNIIVNTISPGMVDTKSFPKSPGRKGVRTAESVKDGLLAVLKTDKTGHYLHVDELDMVRAKGLDDSNALKPINEITFSV